MSASNDIKLPGDNEKDVLFICSCGDTEHQLIMRYWDDDDDEFPEVYTSIYLAPERKWWKRVIYAVKYIFGYRSKYGAFDEFIFKPTDGEKLKEVADYLIRSDRHLREKQVKYIEEKKQNDESGSHEENK